MSVAICRLVTAGRPNAAENKPIACRIATLAGVAFNRHSLDTLRAGYPPPTASTRASLRRRSAAAHRALPGKGGNSSILVPVPGESRTSGRRAGRGRNNDRTT